MNKLTPITDVSKLSPFMHFTRQQWATARQISPIPLAESELEQLRGRLETVDMSEVADVYMPLAQLLLLHYQNSQLFHRASDNLLGRTTQPTTYIIGLAGSVAVGKSTTARIIKSLLERLQQGLRVYLIPTDGFLYSRQELTERDLLTRKGFPESYNAKALLDFVFRLKSGERNLKIPQYSHELYDIVPNRYTNVDGADIVILEGLNVLQTPSQPFVDYAFVSDYFDFSLYIDAPTEYIASWYIKRFIEFSRQARHDEKLYFHRFSTMSSDQIKQNAQWYWKNINEKNLYENILPTRQRASIILTKGLEHDTRHIAFRKT